ncbi:conserved Plasmodium protein, unknown function [Plasmodium chabaudi chabaudi]|uniref:Uncharacterized protein n=1 Tax=Plasmodium chabaudi chabaudi TaxID=31271 RepID=A0A1D3RYC3_PLACU|nr:conserved Plasmodium protein, unknown function [Plasmodium chabaudi chabaudi]
MEKDANCQTDTSNISEEIHMSDNLNAILVSYAKNVILFNPGKDCSDEDTIKNNIYMWSKEYFKKLYEESKDDKISLNSNSNGDAFDTGVEGNQIKDKIIKEMEKVTFHINN